MKPLLINIDNFLKNEDFSPEAMDDIENWAYFTKLSELKDGFKNFLAQPAISISPSEILNMANKFIIQIQRLRLVIDPNYKLVEQIHGDRKYLHVRTDWVDDNGEKKRIVSRCIRRIYPKDKKKVSMRETREIILEALREKYKESEEKFVNEIV